MSKQEYAQQIADDLIVHLDEYYSLPEVWDNELDRKIHEWYANAPKVFPKRPYFSPSAANSCPRELFYKAKRAPKDGFRKQPHTGRWTAIGTAVGDVIQRDILAMQRNLEDKSGMSPRFRFERTENDEPMFEDFAKKNHLVRHKGKKFYLFGTCDGIMKYVSEDGEVVRVGLEVKSKQTTAAKTSLYTMRQPEEKHVKQCISYGEMYSVDYYVILYVNTAHKGWSYSKEDYEKNPDIRAFGLHITDEMKEEVFDSFVEILQSVEDNEPLPLDLDKWTFNNFKEVISKDLSREELKEIEKYKEKMSNSNLPQFMKNNIIQAVEQIEELREVE